MDDSPAGTLQPWTPPDGAVIELPVDQETMRRLEGQGCIDCGTSEGLSPAGYRYTTDHEGGPLGWPVVACPEHQGAGR